MRAAAVFLDRDGTIIENAGYIGDADDVRLVPGAAEAIRRCSRLGYRVVLVSNQSGVARGLFDEEALARVHARVEELLEASGARLDAVYYCPYLDGPEAKVEAYRRDSELRKPAPGMLQRAAREWNIDLSRSWMIGDSPTDVEAGTRAGCRTILIGENASNKHDTSVAPTRRAEDIAAAAHIIEAEGNVAVPEAPLSDEPTTHAERMVTLLEQILEYHTRARREQRQQDFSVLRLFGALLQMLAIVSALWGVAALFADQSAAATARLALACFLQVASLSTFAVDRLR